MSLQKYIIDEFISSSTLFGTPVFYIPAIIYVSHLNLKNGLAILIAMIALEALCAGIKLAFPKERPKPREKKGLHGKYDAASFPSIHTARIALLSILIYSQYGDWLIGATGTAMTAAVGYSRIRLKAHYPKDVIAGIAISAAIGWAAVLVQNGAY